MRRTWLLVVALLVILSLSGCDLAPQKGDDCVGEPGEAGGGVSVCTRPPPTQFNQPGY